MLPVVGKKYKLISCCYYKLMSTDFFVINVCQLYVFHLIWKVSLNLTISSCLQFTVCCVEVWKPPYLLKHNWKTYILKCDRTVWMHQNSYYVQRKASAVQQSRRHNMAADDRLQLLLHHQSCSKIPGHVQTELKTYKRFPHLELSRVYTCNINMFIHIFFGINVTKSCFGICVWNFCLGTFLQCHF